MPSAATSTDTAASDLNPTYLASLSHKDYMELIRQETEDLHRIQQEIMARMKADVKKADALVEWVKGGFVGQRPF